MRATNINTDGLCTSVDEVMDDNGVVSCIEGDSCIEWQELHDWLEGSCGRTQYSDAHSAIHDGGHSAFDALIGGIEYPISTVVPCVHGVNEGCYIGYVACKYRSVDIPSCYGIRAVREVGCQGCIGICYHGIEIAACKSSEVVGAVIGDTEV